MEQLKNIIRARRQPVSCELNSKTMGSEIDPIIRKIVRKLGMFNIKIIPYFLQLPSLK